MYILNYSKCSRCIDYKANIKQMLKLKGNEEVVDKIVSYSCCNYCSRMLEFEDNITNKIKSNAELQIEYFIQKRCPFNHQDKIATKISKLIDIINSEESPFTNVIESFLKTYRRNFFIVFKKLLFSIKDKDNVKEIVNEYDLKVCEYPYYNKIYPENCCIKWYFMNTYLN